jgi:hypothetical protein
VEGINMPMEQLGEGKGGVQRPFVGGVTIEQDKNMPGFASTTLFYSGGDT